MLPFFNRLLGALVDAIVFPFRLTAFYVMSWTAPRSRIAGIDILDFTANGSGREHIAKLESAVRLVQEKDPRGGLGWVKRSSALCPFHSQIRPNTSRWFPLASLMLNIPRRAQLPCLHLPSSTKRRMPGSGEPVSGTLRPSVRGLRGCVFAQSYPSLNDSATNPTSSLTPRRDSKPRFRATVLGLIGDSISCGAKECRLSGSLHVSLGVHPLHAKWTSRARFVRRPRHSRNLRRTRDFS
jgi:hypothetical protein